MLLFQFRFYAKCSCFVFFGFFLGIRFWFSSSLCSLFVPTPHRCKPFPVPEGFHFSLTVSPRLLLCRSLRLSSLLCLRGTKGEKREKNTDMKVLLIRRALVYSFLNLNYLEQKHCCLKSAFSGAYFSRLPLTQDWLPFSGLTCPRNDH